MSKGEKKTAYFAKLESLLDTYKTIFIVNVDNVSSQQMHTVRRALRGDAEVLMGKNTMIRRALRDLVPTHPNYESLLPYVRGNVGFVFTNADMKEIREKIISDRVAAPARAGALAPLDVFVPAGNTGMEPGQTSFFQALGIPTKIARGTIEIVSDVHLVKVGEKVGASEATLLNKLGISPFTYGLGVEQIYDDGTTFSPAVLDITEEDLIKHLMEGITTIAAVSLAANYLALPAVPHITINVFKEVLAISVATDYTIKAAESIKELLDNPEAMAAAAAAAAAPAASSAPAAAAAAEESDEESDEDMGMGLFD
ncbi:ribosomal protein P0 (A0) (L10E) [Coemansia sp. RSA 2523]|nr:ribosomal protein P0 (A0) (L10E) [Coemansia sp. RSA 1591]KAJ1777001.1 ribosomal protein P0 (A0) (L10E) [Coemansia sp. RSA 1824]KAJ1790685.1 ribosomal protein P0 (A0) (L10E) [Coemansia sp. RSA 2167]KAJ1807246.1 ribosomal protein P0 (A0) (L10E) [Coemansia sp. RSA 2523]KAJ2132879.1 ribosomal protein P0 (A0) (L10E) [Coemansia sp. RSA 788]KAJ2147510.1 ribosomal protein P0 (A0) (L10E) [Coemansia sp. RSA 564]KAJ2168524.1 ribosomal protein P0 (A0) (L10E) [Coemansia sp. RSA 562]KAJ2183836.1 riboso